MNRRENCCDGLVVLKTQRQNDKKDITDLKELYKPVARLGVMFYFCLTVLLLLLGLTGYVWTRVDTVRDNVIKILATNESIEKSLAEIKSDIKGAK